MEETQAHIAEETRNSLPDTQSKVSPWSITQNSEIHVEAEPKIPAAKKKNDVQENEQTKSADAFPKKKTKKSRRMIYFIRCSGNFVNYQFLMTIVNSHRHIFHRGIDMSSL